MEQSKRKQTLYIILPIVILGLFVITIMTARGERSLFSDNYLRPIDSKQCIQTTSADQQLLCYDFTLPSDYGLDAGLFFRCRNSEVVVYIGNFPVYRYSPNMHPLLNKSSGTTFHEVDLAPGMKGSVVHIELRPIYSPKESFVDYIYIGNAGLYVQMLMIQSFSGFLICFIMLIVGCLMVAISMLLQIMSVNRKSIYYLGICSILVSLWSSHETMAFQLLLPNTELLHSFNYLLLMLIPSSALLFISHLVDSRLIILNKIALWLTGAVIVTSFLLNFFRIFDYHESLFLTHSLLAICSIMIVIIIIQSERKRTFQNKRSKESTRILYGGFLAVLLFGTIDLYRYLTISQNNVALFTRTGLLIYILVLGFIIIENGLRIIRMGYEAEIMRKMAFTDILTGLPNRSAFQIAEQEIIASKDPYSMIGIVQFDINNLKQVNDTLGHAYGDRYIDIVNNGWHIYLKDICTYATLSKVS